MPRLNSRSGSVPTLGAMYMVAGLPRDPQHWTPADPEGISPTFSPGAIQRRYRPEVLGSTIAGALAQRDPTALDQPRRARKKSHRTSTVPVEPQLSRDEAAAVQAKALKLLFTKDVEVVTSTLAPSPQSFFFAFTVPSSDITAPKSSFDATIAARSSLSSHETTYYASALLIFSHADASRAEAIRAAIEQGGSHANRSAIAQAMKAAASGRRLNKSLQSRLRSGGHSLVSTQSMTSLVASKDGASDTEAYATDDTEFAGDSAPTARAVTYLPSGTPIWLPYALVLISKYPLCARLQRRD